MNRMIKLLLLTIFLQLIANFSWAQYRLGKSENPIIEKMTAQYKNRDLNMAEIDQIVRDLSQSGLFQVVFAEKTGATQVIIRAQQSTKLYKITVLGNASYTQSELQEKMKLKVGQKVSRLEIKQAVERIKDLYAESGFYNFQINHSREQSPEGTHLIINIQEKDFCIIEEIQFFSKSDYLNNQLSIETQNFVKSNYKKFTSSNLAKKIENYLLENRYLTAKISDVSTVFNKDKTKVKISYTISNPIQFEFVFHGNQYFSHFDLIKESQIGGKFLYLSDSSSEIIDNIQQLYIRNGFPKVQISFSERQFSDIHKKVLVFDINEGPRVKIGKINIIGKLSKSKSYYLKIFKSTLADESHSIYFVQNDIKNASENLINSLKREGYLQAELLSTDIEYSKDDYANITLQVDENILTYVRQVLFRGSKSFNNIELKEVVEIESNKPLLIKSIEDSFAKLEEFYKENGYLEFSIKNKNASVINYQPGQPYADIVFQIEEGPKITVKKILVKGIQKTKEYVVIRELDFIPGEVLSLSKVTTSIDRLEKIGLFSKVNIKSLEQNTSKSERTIVIELEERKPGLFSAGAGIQNEGLLTYRGYVGALYNNLWGKARGISGRADINYRDMVNYLEHRIAASYYEPYLFKDRVRGRISVVREQELFDFIENDSTILSRNDIRFSAEKEFSKKFRFTYNVWEFSNQTTFNVRDKVDRGTINIGTTGPVFEFDHRNDQFLPTEGNYTRVDVELAHPWIGSSKGNQSNNDIFNPDNRIEFFKTSLSTTFYTPLTKSNRWVWANTLRGGYLTNLSDEKNSGIPTTKSFFLGGSSSLRGFSLGTTETVPGKRELCVKNGLLAAGNPNTNDCEFNDIFVKDDSTFFLVKSEIRFPIYGNIGGMLFYDGGAVFLGDFKLEDPYRDSVGFGLRYDTPVGAFVMGLGYKLDRKKKSAYYDEEGEVAFHLAIGTF